MQAVLGGAKPHSFEFENYCLVPSERLLLRDGEPVDLPPKIFETLLALVENSGRLVDKNELMSRLWPDTYVGEATLSRNISDLRKALGETGYEHRFIETVPKSGYRFVAAVRPLPSEQITNTAANRLREAAVGTIRPAEEKLRLVDSRTGAEANRGIRLTRSRFAAMTALMVLFTVVLIVLAWRSFSPFSAKEKNASSPVRSIAVLPFKSVSGPERDEALELGVADALITRLSNLKQFTIRPSRAVFRYAGQSADPVQAGRELKVDTVLDGNIQRQGDRIRVSVQLVNVADGAARWANTFEARATDFFAIQDSLSEQITRALTLELTGREENTLAGKRRTANAEAYKLYLKGRFWFGKNAPDGFQKAIACYEQAIAIDPNYASAYSGLADVYSVQAAETLLPPSVGLMKAKAAAEKAVELDDGLAEVHSSLGHLRWLTWDWAGAEKEFLRVAEINPPYPGAQLWYANYLSSLGRHSEAFAIIRKAQEKNPISTVVNECAERTYFFARQYDEAIATGLKNLELEPDNRESMHWLALAYEQKRMYEEAIATQLKLFSLRGVKSEEVEALRAAYKSAGWRGYWLKEIEMTQERAKVRYVSPVRLAQLYARIDDKERSFGFLQKAYSEHSDQLTLLKVDPVFDPLRSDSRYHAMLRRVGFPQ